MDLIVSAVGFESEHAENIVPINSVGDVFELKAGRNGCDVVRDLEDEQ